MVPAFGNQEVSLWGGGMSDSWKKGSRTSVKILILETGIILSSGHSSSPPHS